MKMAVAVSTSLCLTKFIPNEQRDTLEYGSPAVEAGDCSYHGHPT